MSIRLPLQTVLDYNDVGNLGATSVAGGVAQTFTLPQDTDNVILKLQASVVGGGVSAYLQTTDDGGTTWYDLGRTSIVSLTSNGTAQFLAAPVVGDGQRTGVVQSASVVSAAIGSPAASTLGSQQMSGLPVLSPLGRIFIQYTGNITNNAQVRVQVKVNSQSRGQ